MIKKSASTKAILRFAPSPNGYLHLGHAFSALMTLEMAERVGGQFKLRIEDIDTIRCRAEFATAIEEDLAWLGVDWSGAVIRQSERFAAYKSAADRLSEMGLLYPCFASRAEIRAAAEAQGLGTDPDGAPLYVGLSKTLSEGEVGRRMATGERHALRLDTRRAMAVYRELSGERPLRFKELKADGSSVEVVADPLRWGDPVLVRKETPASYHLSVVVDDAWQRITHVTRGQDLFAATDLQRLLQELLRLPEPVYHHHALLLDEDGGKLSKSDGATALRSLRERGVSPLEVRTMIAEAKKLDMWTAQESAK